MRPHWPPKGAASKLSPAPINTNEAGGTLGLMAGPPTRGSQRIRETEPAPTLGAQSRSPYLAVECAVSTLQAAGPVSTLQTVEPAPPLSRDSRKLGTSNLQAGLGDSSLSHPGHRLDIPRVFGECGGGIPAAAAPRMPHARQAGYPGAPD